jgi:hypothetical protein
VSCTNPVRVLVIIVVSLFLLVVSTVLTLAAPARARGGGWTGVANFMLGQKVLDESDWQPVESQDLFGVEVSWGEKSWPIQIATDPFASYKGDSNEGLTAKTSDLEWEFERSGATGMSTPTLGQALPSITVRPSGTSPRLS